MVFGRGKGFPAVTVSAAFGEFRFAAGLEGVVRGGEGSSGFCLRRPGAFDPSPPANPAVVDCPRVEGSAFEVSSRLQDSTEQ